VIRFYNFNILLFLSNKKYLVKLFKRLKKIHSRRLKKIKKLKKYKWLHGPLSGEKLSKFYIKNRSIWYLRKQNYLTNLVNTKKYKKIQIVTYIKKIEIILYGSKKFI
jgi:hypothetical protein